MQVPESSLVELRHYRLRDLASRDYFERRSRAVTFPLFEKYEFKINKFWNSAEDPLDVYYVVGWNSLEEKERKWAELQADALWADMVNADDYVSPVERSESVILKPFVGFSQP